MRLNNILFLLAGYSSAGKSTLLLNAINKNLPVFGQEYNEIFQTTTIPAKFPDWMLSAQERLNQGSWFNEGHVPFLANTDLLPNHIVLHFDLIQILHERYFIQSCPDEILALLPRTFNSFANSAHNEMFFRHIVSNPFFENLTGLLSTRFTPDGKPMQGSGKKGKVQWSSRKGGSGRFFLTSSSHGQIYINPFMAAG